MICIKHKVEFSEDCPQCALDTYNNKPASQLLFAELENLYREGKPYKMVYISDIEGNLNNIHRHFTEAVKLDNLDCTITLTFTAGCRYLKGPYSHIFIDSDINTEETILSNIAITENAKVMFVNPSSQNVIN